MNNLIPRNNGIPSLLNDVFFKDFFGDDFFAPLPSLRKINYPVDIRETKNGSLELNIAAIGLDKPDIKIDIKDNVLSVSHEKKESKNDKDCLYKGITSKAFNLAWRISDKFDLSKTEATLEKGLLRIVIPVAPEKAPKQIEVEIK